MGSTASQDKGNNGDHRMQRAGDVAGAMVERMGVQRSGQPTTTRKPRSPRHQGQHATPETLRAKATALLPTSGKSAATPSVSPCALCGGAGRVREWVGPEDWRTRDVACGCAAGVAAGRERALAASDISPLLRTLDFAGYDARYNAAALAAASTWASDLACERSGGATPRPWLFLFGGTGTGKTHLLAAAFNVLLGNAGSGGKRGVRYPLYTVVPAMSEYIREGLDEPNSREYGLRFKAVRDTPILLLDDLGAERRTDWSDELLFKLLDHRYREGMPTAVASNLIPADLEPRIASRLQDRALSTVLLMSGPDYRLLGGSQRSSGERKAGHA